MPKTARLSAVVLMCSKRGCAGSASGPTNPTGLSHAHGASLASCRSCHEASDLVFELCCGGSIRDVPVLMLHLRPTPPGSCQLPGEPLLGRIACLCFVWLVSWYSLIRVSCFRYPKQCVTEDRPRSEDQEGTLIRRMKAKPWRAAPPHTHTHHYHYNNNDDDNHFISKS